MGLVWGQGYGGAHIGLYEVDLLVRDANFGRRATERRDDTQSDGRVETDGIADGDHPVAHLQVVGAAERGNRQSLAARLDLHGREVHVLVTALDDAFEGAPIGEGDGDLVGILDDMRVGEDHAVLIQDHAAALPRLAPRTLSLIHI